jgi:Ni/Co efflux regulator RcnB
MNSLCRAFAVSTLALSLTASIAIAQDHPDNRDQHDQQHQQYVRHDDWKKGHKISHDDWNRGQVVAESDWHSHHLRRPPAGYEWRYVDGNYVLANNDGLIFSVVIGH